MVHQALAELELVRQLQPKSMETLFALGKLLFRMGNTSLALVRWVSFLPSSMTRHTVDSAAVLMRAAS